MWDLEDGEVKGSFESYARSGGESTEPCTSSLIRDPSTPAFCLTDYHSIQLPIERCSAATTYTAAWSVSLNPRGGTYASTGGSGNVTIHSAEPGSFGERRATLTSGRSKFGMFCKHVSHAGSLAQMLRLAWTVTHHVTIAESRRCTSGDVFRSRPDLHL